MIENNKPRTVKAGYANPADDQSVSAAYDTHSGRQFTKCTYTHRDSLPYITKSISDDAFLASKNCADDHLKHNGLTPIWSLNDLARERKILLDKYINEIYDIEVANV